MQAAEAVHSFAGLLPNERLALAVSGGSDSVAMLHLAVQVRKPSSLVALTVDHGLREGSQAEAEDVARMCAALGIEHHILNWVGPKATTGLQAKARKMRYDLMTAWCVVQGVGVLATAHTRNDQAETVAMRKARTDSVKSIAAIWPERDWNGVRIIRPVLAQTRESLRIFLRQLGVMWADDPSNENRRFERVRVRQELPADSHAALASEAEQAQGFVRETQEAARVWLKVHAAIHPTGMVTLPRPLFRKLASATAREVLAFAITMAGSGKDPERAILETTTAQALADGPSRLTVAGAFVVTRKAHILVGREAGRIDPQPLAIPESTTLLWDGRFVICGPPGATVEKAGVRCPRLDKVIPAFVLAGLPVIRLGDEPLVVPHFEQDARIVVRLGDRFRI